MDYSQYTVEDFMLDERFRKWIYNPDKDDNLYWENWLAKNPKKSGELVEARNILLNLSMKDYSLTEEETADIWEKIDAKVDKGQDDFLETKVIPISAHSILTRTEVKRSNYQWIKIAAVILILIVSSIAIIKIKAPHQAGEVAQEMVEKETMLGMKSEITLSDGTIIILNSESKITYLPNFTNQSRDVYLEGEAYFDVAKDANRPFNVHSGGVITTALGTAFNVNSYRDDDKGILIALIEGKVRVSSEKNSMDYILSPGEMATYDLYQENIVVSEFDEREITSWKKGSLYFSHAQEAEVFKRMERWYGVNIQLENSTKKKWDYSGEFKNQSINQILTSLSFTMSFDYRIKDSNIYITYKNH